MTRAIILGAGTYGSVYAAYLSESYDVIGFLDDDCQKIGTRIGTIEVLGTTAELADTRFNGVSVFAPIGSNRVRARLLQFASDLGYRTPSFIHHSAEVHPSVTVGAATYILPSSSIMPFSSLGRFTMVSMGVNIAHHTFVGEACFFSQGSNVGASIHIGDRAFLGIASTVMTGVLRIGCDAVVGAGAVVIRDVADCTTVVGVPATPITRSKSP